MSDDMVITGGSLFTGWGLFDLGMEQAGIRVKWQVEINKHARQHLERRWPGVKRYSDVREFPPRWSGPPGRNPFRVDVLFGGDPCQENSGARVGRGLSQASLGGEFVAIVEALRPRVVVRENPTRVRPDAPWPWWRFRDALERLGYTVLPFRLRACCFGADHQRDRLFLLAEDANSDLKPFWLSGRCPTAGTPETVQGAEWQRQRVWPDAGAVVRDERRGNEPRDGRANDGSSRRVDIARLKGLGNGVYVDAARWIGKRIVEAWELGEGTSE